MPKIQIPRPTHGTHVDIFAQIDQADPRRISVLENLLDFTEGSFSGHDDHDPCAGNPPKQPLPYYLQKRPPAQHPNKQDLCPTGIYRSFVFHNDSPAHYPSVDYQISRKLPAGYSKTTLFSVPIHHVGIRPLSAVLRPLSPCKQTDKPHHTIMEIQYTSRRLYNSVSSHPSLSSFARRRRQKKPITCSRWQKQL